MNNLTDYYMAKEAAPLGAALRMVGRGLKGAYRSGGAKGVGKALKSHGKQTAKNIWGAASPAQKMIGVTGAAGGAGYLAGKKATS